jgi:MFS family permease
MDNRVHHSFGESGRHDKGGITLRIQGNVLSRPMWILLGGILIFHFSMYMILPYIPILFSKQYGIPLSVVGAILGTQSISYLAGSLFGGWLTDHMGRRVITAAGIFLQGISLSAYAFAHTPALLFTVAAVNGISGGLYTPAAKSGIAALASDDTRTTAFSLRGIAANIGTTLGPLLGTFLFAYSYRLLFLVAGMLCILLAPVHAFGLSRELSADKTRPKPSLALREVLRDLPFLVFSSVTVLIWALYTQLTLAVPLRASEILTSTTSVGMLWTVSSILIIMAQNGVTRATTRYWHPLTIIAAGTLLLGVGLGTVAFSTHFVHLLVSVLIVTAGEMLIMPTIDSVISQFSKPETLGSYFGIASFVWGLGQSLGNFAGGELMQRAEQTGALEMPWIVFFLFGLALAGLTFYLRYWDILYKIMVGSTNDWDRASSSLRASRKKLSLTGLTFWRKKMRR